MLQYI